MTALTDHVALASILLMEKRALEALHDAHVQLRLLLEAGDSRYLGWALDDLVEATETLTEVDAERRSITGERNAEQCIATPPSGMQPTLIRIVDEIADLLRRVEDERARARLSCHVRIQTGDRQHR